MNSETPLLSNADLIGEKVRRLQGPIMVLGAGGFVGANLLHTVLRYRDDVLGVVSRLPAWRLDGVVSRNVRAADLLVKANQTAVLDDFHPRTIFDCVAYGAYSFENDSGLIYETNFNRVTQLLALLKPRMIACYVHAGTSSEYGDNAAAPPEDAATACNSDYAVSKVATANLLHYYGKRLGMPVANLRLYSIYGPLEDSSRLVPNVILHGLENRLPEFVDPNISRDFIFIDDVCEAFFDTALNLAPAHYGESFNIGSGHKTTIGEVANLARELFAITEMPVFNMPNRRWDVTNWYANPEKARRVLGWSARTGLHEGFARTIDWMKGIDDRRRYIESSKRHGLDTKHSVSAVIACYKDNKAIPIMYQRLTDVFSRLGIDYEIIFVNDCSPDDSEEIIRSISSNDRRVIGISHSRNFGSQAAFRSGMELSRKNACVLLDGDLQDPPELIEQFVFLWRQGHDVVYGRRVKREATLLMQLAYKLFYRVFDYFSYVRIPHDAGDFSLLDRRVVDAMLGFPERDLFLRGVRAYAGFRQAGVDYVRPERLFGRSTNNFLKNIGWAKKGILSFSDVPLNVLTVVGTSLFLMSILLAVVQIVIRLAVPTATPSGITTVLLAVLFFGAINLFSLALVGEYVAKIFEETKGRPHFIRRSIVRDGQVRPVTDLQTTTG